ncbi:MAG: hypothetical protein A3A96_03200 [Candidatus Zambryskibacteria bacterium RIFCSPLOWO2_01_FULL_39_39]|uniref:DUF4258 domain-containing protein n=1 Tax=Candidatus Zambryskibacteria bacterium RIFCSPLOWO2_01_FULL_39_39 TaxID=1802758 RepID=A0A1G2TWH3_9BACT|nr:MAG: hypothetical protein A2644_02590 [Candidatus Zambryskibacteria bacterium RIFCSPHIGHO2_01_FULL_39_63]OHA94399.1 MAG: hypothetical protein A3B88_01725 [Candidatus Zambryskibacteria bacterium RIFCSPHIGHO2_02_FULL_39_19]OHA98789.1 MAG: hypothetical protein A3F20_00885 [Candidatus Zambryskibacteria bacterium RIFCSPHIGHO2_12_FULL_39_21]OHB01647.1 MAG: hypothetical protein A3A96_03200 [Candidatus Zambryskibacteria bacterium RIFCSPLOWO2_01_FULL_39_39]
MKEIIYSSHLKFRIKMRNIPFLLPKQIYQNAKERYFDVATGNKVAIKRVLYNGGERDMMVAYEENTSEIILITIHPLKLLQKFNRIKTKRWKKL